MSCDSNNKIACLANQISGGISQLSSKQAFYVGMAVGAGAIAARGAGAYTFAKRRSGQNGRRSNPIA